MNRMDLVEKIAEKNAISKAEANRILGTVIEEVMAAVKAGESLTLVGFGTFEVRERAAKTARNPRTGETIDVPACKVPAFKAGKALKDAVAK